MTNPRIESKSLPVDELNLPTVELKKHVENLHNTFTTIWNKYPKLTEHAHRLYRDSQIDPNLESLEQKFNVYRSKKEIINDFTLIMDNWEKLNETTKNNSFYRGYYLVLLTMELHYLDALAQKLAESPIEEKEDLNEETIDADEVALNFLLQFKYALDKIIVNNTAQLKSQISQETSLLDDKINAFNERCKKIEEKYTEKDTESVGDKIKQLFEHEKIYFDQAALLEILQKERVELSKLRDKQATQHNLLIDQCNLSNRQLFQAYHLEDMKLDYSLLPQFQIKEKIIQRLENKKEAILRENYSTSEHLELKNILKANLKEIDKHLKKYESDHQGVFVSDKELANQTHKELMKSYRFLENSPALTINIVDHERCQELSTIVLESETRKDDLKKLKKSIEDRIDDYVLKAGGQARIKEEILELNRKEFLLRTQLTDIAPIPVEIVAKRREILDRAWEEVLVSQEALDLVEKELSSTNPLTQQRLKVLIEKNKKNTSKSIAVDEGSELEEPRIVNNPPAIAEEKDDAPSQLTEDRVDVLPGNISDPIKDISYFARFLEGLQFIYNKVKQFFSYCFSCFTCCRPEEKIEDEPVAETPTKNSEIRGSTSSYPFPISSSQHMIQTVSPVVSSEVPVFNSVSNTSSLVPTNRFNK